MKAVFVEMPVFEKCRSDYLNDDEYLELQNGLLKAPRKGEVIQGSGGLRKIRWVDSRRGKGKRSGTRIIYYLDSTLKCIKFKPLVFLERLS